MLDFLRDTGRRIAIALGFLLSALGAVAFVAPLPTLAGLAPDTVAVVVVAVGTGLLGWALWDQHSEINRKDMLLDDKARLEEAREAFRLRLDEGNVLARTLPRARIRAGTTPTEEERLEWTKRVGDWNTACVETVGEYLKHRAPIMEAPVKRGEGPSGSVVRWAHNLHEEVSQKVDRMSALQLELSQSRRDAISCTVHT